MISAATRYRRVAEALAVIGPAAGDDLPAARMMLAAEVLREAGLAVDLADGPDLAHRAARWRCYADGPVTPLHAACGSDVARGLLRSWERRRRATTAPALRGARIRLAARCRTACAALRDELRDDAARLPGPVTRRRLAGFAEHAAQRAQVCAAAVADALADEVGYPAPPPQPALPPLRRTGPENRLSAVVGGFFGLGAALLLTRLLTGPLPQAAAASAGLAAGLALGGWVVWTRRLLAGRAAADRWAVEAAAAVRAALDEHLAAELAATAQTGHRGG